jgi:hypothetical protein
MKVNFLRKIIAKSKQGSDVLELRELAVKALETVVSSSDLKAPPALTPLNEQYSQFLSRVVAPEIGVSQKDVRHVVNLCCGLFPVFEGVRHAFSGAQIVGVESYGPLVRIAKMRSADDNHATMVKRDVLMPINGYQGKISLAMMNHPPGLPPLPEGLTPRQQMDVMRQVCARVDNFLKASLSLVKGGGGAVFTFPVDTDFKLYNDRVLGMQDYGWFPDFRVVASGENFFGTVEQTRGAEFREAVTFIESLESELDTSQSPVVQLASLKRRIDENPHQEHRPIAELQLAVTETWPKKMGSSSFRLSNALRTMKSNFVKLGEDENLSYIMHRYFMIVKRDV